MDPQFKRFLILTTVSTLGATPLFGHIGISGDRTLGSLEVGNPATIVATRSARGSFGWADGTDSNWGDSHRVVAFQFELTSPVETVRISVSRRDDAGQNGASGIFTPGFSLYQRDGAFVSATHDSGIPTVNHLASTFGASNPPESFTDSNGNGYWDPGEVFVDTNGNGYADTVSLGNSGKEGAFNAVGDWTIFNDSAESMTFDYVGHASSASDSVTYDFVGLGVGTYYLFVGGSNYAAQQSEALVSSGAHGYPIYGFTLEAQAIPEPGVTLLLMGAGAVFVIGRRFLHKS